MGLNPFGRHSDVINQRDCRSGNPNPDKWSIKRHSKVGKYLIVEMNYPDCINYHGDKILMFENCSIEKLEERTTIDPHFDDNSSLYGESFSPVARFEPTVKGWNMAHRLAHMDKFTKWNELYPDPE